MANTTEPTKYVFHLFIILIAIIIVLLVKKYSFNDSFVGKVPITPIGNGVIIPGVYPTGQPMMYETQLYPARLPWYPETGRPCGSSGCGITGMCVDGICQMREQTGTAFGVRI